MDPTALRDPSKCPDWAGVLSPEPVTCPACGLPLPGPLVEQLRRLSQQAAYALEQRQSVIAALRGRTAPVPPTVAATRRSSNEGVESTTVRATRPGAHPRSVARRPGGPQVPGRPTRRLGCRRRGTRTLRMVLPAGVATRLQAPLVLGAVGILPLRSGRPSRSGCGTCAGWPNASPTSAQ